MQKSNLKICRSVPDFIAFLSEMEKILFEVGKGPYGVEKAPMKGFIIIV